MNTLILDPSFHVPEPVIPMETEASIPSAIEDLNGQFFLRILCTILTVVF